MADRGNDRALELTAKLLADAKALPWKTAPYLSRRLREVHHVDITPPRLEQALVDHAGHPLRLIRYSFFPARKTLDLLWGHVCNVGEFAELPDVLLQGDPEIGAMVGDISPQQVPETAPWCFLSHSFRDLDTVIRLRNEIVDRGYGVWLAEVEIEPEGMITAAVQEGLHRSDKLVAFISPRSIGSRWVLKEVAVAVHSMKLPPILIVDGSSPELIELFSAWITDNDNWGSQVGVALERLIDRDHSEQAATELSGLVVGGLGDVPPELRRATVYPEESPPGSPGFLRMDEAFAPPQVGER